MKKKPAHLSLFLLSSVVLYMFLFFVYGDIKLRGLNLAWEPVPEEHYDIIEKKIVWNNKQFLKRLYLKNNEAKYMPLIDEAIERAGLPNDLRFVPYVESALNSNAISNKWAVGLWQIMPETGRGFGMRIDESFDERYNKEVSTSVALEYFISLRDQFPNWTLATAAYNRWQNWLRRDMEASDSENFYEIETAAETKNYIYKLLAFKYGR